MSAIRFELPGGGRALFTSRAHGNLSTLRGAAPEHGRAERDRLCAELGLRGLCASRQVHGTVVHRVTAVDGGGKPVALDADGHATALRGVGAMVLVADCLPVIVGGERAIAALHAGWRGLAAGVLEEGVRAVRELGGDGEITAVIGPGARVCCYEVGEEVHAAFDRGAHRRGRHLGHLDLAPASGHLDLAAHARERLRDAGVASVRDTGVCTICDERFFSYRREHLAAGRQAGIAWLSATEEWRG